MTTNASVGNHHDQLRMRAGLRQLGQAARASAAATATAAAAPPPPSPCGAPPTQGCGCCTGADMWDSPSCQQPVATPLQPSRQPWRQVAPARRRGVLACRLSRPERVRRRAVEVDVLALAALRRLMRGSGPRVSRIGTRAPADTLQPAWKRARLLGMRFSPLQALLENQVPLLLQPG